MQKINNSVVVLVMSSIVCFMLLIAGLRKVTGDIKVQNKALNDRAICDKQLTTVLSLVQEMKNICEIELSNWIDEELITKMGYTKTH